MSCSAKVEQMRLLSVSCISCSLLSKFTLQFCRRANLTLSCSTLGTGSQIHSTSMILISIFWYVHLPNNIGFNNQFYNVKRKNWVPYLKTPVLKIVLIHILIEKWKEYILSKTVCRNSFRKKSPVIWSHFKRMIC